VSSVPGTSTVRLRLVLNFENQDSQDWGAAVNRRGETYPSGFAAINEESAAERR
jgi:hypothetical protein